MLSLVHFLLLCCKNYQIYSIVSFHPWVLRMGSREGGELEVVIPFDNSQLEMGHQVNGPNLWAGKENLLPVSPVCSLKPPQLMTPEGGGKLSLRRAQLGLVCCPSMMQKGCRGCWLDQDSRGVVLLNLSALPEGSLPHLRGSKPTCPECRGLPGWAEGINTQHSMNLMYVSHAAFLISYTFIVEKSNKLQYH